ncbi:outer membrane protein assembly factor BamB [Lysobacter helvus]|uniref:Outer membrane protein assembly factor BamB n=2 Tax=Lysobacteraceae TaxID=32033 RepID=A0ABM7Q8M1_9GAMM|nr:MULTISPECIES: outer membrane protein assembly factor BamB [Lysobacter]BCT93789.1 outer membrane protein assembly factor BamB [Lysobacter caseinilyticus]BCT96945.1 outer membrane protein assembly factor BamB [Lysobacter helvus]
MKAPTPVKSSVQRVSLVLCCVIALAGCSTVKGWFGAGKDEKKALEPAELTEFTPTATVKKLWSAKAGGGEGAIGVRQGPSVADGKVFMAAVEGGVRAVDLQTGAEAWKWDPKREKGKEKLRLSGGPGAGNGLVVVGGLDGEVIALDESTGAEKWHARVGNEVIAAPVIGEGLVFVRANDGVVTAFDAASGERRWFWQRELPALTVRGNDSVALGPGFVFVGNDDGSVTALSSTDGRLLWEQSVAQAEGRSELDRMSDIDGTPVIDGTTLYATSFKKQTMAIDGPSGRPIWQRDNGGAGRVGNGSDRVVVADPAGAVWAIDKATGGSLWQQPALARRNLAGVAVQGDYAVVADYDGYVHWLRLDTGAFAARSRVGGDPVRATPVVADGVLLVQNIDGEVTAFRIQ